MILVTGASGQVGKHLLRALSGKGIPARAWIHRKENETALEDAAKEFEK
ncbi:MAG TPA: NAD-dependent epimerase/dehydratase family protein [Candidatus Enterocloster faecavium]|uniref:NAD-dependent epimerase/dehydratase family protein n=1 Tax=Candidatus Enterocloster faecavium TaxID=2838560 RepID=A0A9D2LA25_9FIRM|nr:NAD-dependent epimerase/dehydratase family protein [Candidatus Enterocloster faecavium]